MALNVDLARRKRRWLDLTQAQLAQRLGVHKETVAAWERGEQEPKVTDAAAWAKALELELAELLADPEPEPAGKAAS